MRVIDTNVLARFFIDDSADLEAVKQKKIATAILSAPVYISSTVVLEFEWVMRGFYKLPKDTVFEILNILIHLKTVNFDNPQAITQAVSLFEAGFDFADALHLSLTQHIGVITSFDKKFCNKAHKQGFNVEFLTLR